MRQLHDSFPILSTTTDERMKFAGNGFELGDVLLLGIQLEKLHMDCRTGGIFRQTRLQHFLGLTVTTIGHQHFGFGNRIDNLLTRQ